MLSGRYYPILTGLIGLPCDTQSLVRCYHHTFPIIFTLTIELSWSVAPPAEDKPAADGRDDLPSVSAYRKGRHWPPPGQYITYNNCSPLKATGLNCISESCTSFGSINNSRYSSHRNNSSYPGPDIPQQTERYRELQIVQDVATGREGEGDKCIHIRLQLGLSLSGCDVSPDVN